MGIGSELIESVPEVFFDVGEEKGEFLIDLADEDSEIWVEGEALCIKSDLLTIRIKGLGSLRGTLKEGLWNRKNLSSFPDLK